MKRFLVVGDANVDIIVSGIDGQPTLGQERACEAFNMVLGGSSGNTASCLAGLEASVDFWGKVGRDALGDFVLHTMEQRNIGVGQLIQDPAIRTGACVALSYSSDRALISSLASIANLRLEDIPMDRIGRYDHMHSGSIFIQHGLYDDFRRLYKTAKEKGLTTSLDCGWDPTERWQVDLPGLLPYVDVFLPNETEALHITGTQNAEAALEALSRMGNTIVIKRGSSGALARSGDQTWTEPGFRIEAFETTGAGDCFNAGYLYASIEKGRLLPEALKFANGCGALAVSTPSGASATFSAEDVERFIQEHLD